MTSESASRSIQAGRTDDVPPHWDERTILTTGAGLAAGPVTLLAWAARP